MRERSVTQVPTRVYKSRRRRRENYLNGSEEFLLQTFVLASLVSEVLLEAVDTATEHVELRLVVGQLLVLTVDCLLVLLPQPLHVIESTTNQYWLTYGVEREREGRLRGKRWRSKNECKNENII